MFGCAESLLLLGLFSSCGEQGLLSSCGAHSSHCNCFSCYRAQALKRVGSVVVAPELHSTGSIAVAHGLGCSEAGGIFPDQGSNPRLLH